MNQDTPDQMIRVNVTVNTSVVNEAFKKIILLMEAAISNWDINAYRDFDTDGAMMRWYEAMDHYLSFMLSHSRANIGIDYYIHEYFARFTPGLNTPAFYSAAGIHFAQAVGVLSQALYLAQQHIEQAGGKVDEVECTPIGLNHCNYLITGNYNPAEMVTSLQPVHNPFSHTSHQFGGLPHNWIV